MKENYYAIIMAGGGGTRLWPVSREKRPKQLLKIANGKSLFQISIDRIRDLFPIENILVVTIADQVESLQREVPDLKKENYLIEPFPKGTASVVGLAAIYLMQKDPDAVMAVLTADHVIENITGFHQLLKEGKSFAEKGYLVTIGIIPDYPATGFGYIQAGKRIKSHPAYQVENFVEKPDLLKAEEYVKKGKYFWNSGMFIWSAVRIMDEFRKLMPGLFMKLMDIKHLILNGNIEMAVQDIWDKIEPQTIDYGIMENADNVVMLSGKNLGWNDVGSWDSLEYILGRDTKGNVIHSKTLIDIDSRNNIVYSENSEKLIAIIGLDEVVVVDSDDALLVCRKGETQKVKRVIEIIKNKKLKEYL